MQAIYDRVTLRMVNAVQTKREAFIAGYVKVSVRSRSPKLWGWAVYRNGGDTAVERSANLFRSAEDAWKAGQTALNNLAPTPKPKMASIELQANQLPPHLAELQLT